MEKFTLITADGLELHGDFSDSPSETLACVTMVHGIGEHFERHGVLRDFLNKSGYATIQFDLRGHGKSDGIRGHSPSYETLLDDVGLAIEFAEEKFPSIPHFLLGHSMGGALVLNFALKRKPDLTGVISLSPGLRSLVPVPQWKLGMANILSGITPALTLYNGVKAEFLTRDKEVVEKTLNDPLYHFKISVRLGIDVLEQGEWALQHASEWNLPLLLMHGTGDRLTSHEASREFESKAGENCTLKLWDGLYHELHHEPEKGDVLDFLIQWLNKRTTVP